MMRRQIIILLFLLSKISFSQTEGLFDKSRFHLSLNTGLNISEFHNDSIIYHSGIKPFIGTSLIYNISHRIDLMGVTDYSIKSSSTIRPNTTIENQYLELAFTPRFEVFPNFHFHTGFSYSYILKSNEIINNGDNWLGIERKRIEGYSSEINVLTGIEFKLQDNVNIFMNYNIPTSRINASNFQIGLSIALNNRIDKEPSYSKKRIETSRMQIKQLKTGVLLVRLRTSENTINAFIKAGENEKACELKLKQERENKEIVSAFKKHFNFCEVRYFYSYNSEKIKQKQFNNIFLNDSLQVDNTITLDTNITCMIAEFAYIEQDTIKFFSHYSYESSKNGRMEKIANYYSSSTDIVFYALRILDHNFVQLNRPFPFYTRAIYKTIEMHPEQLLFFPPIYSVFLSWSCDNTVSRMNKKLEKYYKISM